MDLRKLQIFSTVARLGSFSEAARELHMAQPAVSIAVGKLERELGLPLFDRGGRRVQLTAEGRDLRQRARVILDQVAELEQALGERRGLLRGELAIACPSMVATYYLPNLLGAFLGEHPGLTASVSQQGTTDIREGLLRDELELGVVSDTGDGPADEELEQVPLLEQPIVLCVHSAHPWAGRREVAVEELQGSPMVVYESGYFIRDRLDSLCTAHGVRPDLRMQSNFLPLLVRMVKQGLGTTIGLAIMAEGEPGVVAVPLAGGARLRMCLARRRGRRISRANQAFFQWAAEQL